MYKYHESDTNLMLYSGKQEDGHLECNICHINNYRVKLT